LLFYIFVLKKQDKYLILAFYLESFYNKVTTIVLCQSKVGTEEDIFSLLKALLVKEKAGGAPAKMAEIVKRILLV
jgi:hypothetical protein